MTANMWINRQTVLVEGEAQPRHQGELGPGKELQILQFSKTSQGDKKDEAEGNRQGPDYANEFGFYPQGNGKPLEDCHEK